MALFRTLRLTPSLLTRRSYQTTYVPYSKADHHEEEKQLLEDEIQHATGTELFELMAQKDKKEVFGPSKLDGPFGTPEKPAYVPSFFNMRFVGCTGPSDDEHEILWHRVHDDKPTICLQCGQFFAIKKLDLPEPYLSGPREDDHGHGHEGHGHH